MRDLEQRDVLVAHRSVPLGGSEQAREQRRAQDRLVARERVGQPQRVAVGVLADEARRVRLREAAAGEHVLDRPPELLLAGEAADRLPAGRQRERHVVEHEARDLLDQIGLARHVPCAPRRRRHRVAVDVELEPAQDAALLVGGNVEAEQRARALRPQLDARSLRQRGVRVGLAHPAGAGRLHDQLRREPGRMLGEIRVDALLPPVRPLGAQREPLGGVEDRDRFEVRRLEEDARRRLG